MMRAFSRIASKILHLRMDVLCFLFA